MSCRCGRAHLFEDGYTGTTSATSSGSTRGGLLSQLHGFKKDDLKKTETRVRTEDGKVLLESHDTSGNYKSVLQSPEQYGFIPDLRRDLQVGVVRDNLIIGSQDVAADWDILQQHKVTHVLNLGSYIRNFFDAELTYLALKLNDLPETQVMPHFERAFKFIDEGRQTGCVLIHCNAGVSRASTFMIGYLMQAEGKPFQEVFEDVKSKRPSICPNVGFRTQLLEYEKSLGLAEGTK